MQCRKRTCKRFLRCKNKDLSRKISIFRNSKNIFRPNIFRTLSGEVDESDNHENGMQVELLDGVVPPGERKGGSIDRVEPGGGEEKVVGVEDNEDTNHPWIITYKSSFVYSNSVFFLRVRFEPLLEIRITLT